jgi:hypothetical protein
MKLVKLKYTKIAKTQSLLLNRPKTAVNCENKTISVPPASAVPV